MNALKILYENIKSVNEKQNTDLTIPAVNKLKNADCQDLENLLNKRNSMS